MGQGPGEGLDAADGEAEIQAGVADELELLAAGFLEDAVEQFLVAQQGGDDHVLEVEHRVDVGFDVDHDLPHHRRRFRLDAPHDQVLHRLRRRFPQARRVVRRHRAGDVVHHFQQRFFDHLGDALRVELVEHVLGADQAVGQQVAGDAGHDRGLARHDALPAQVGRLEADELDRLEHHADRDDLGDEADDRRHERHRDVDDPVLLHIRDDVVPALHLDFPGPLNLF